MPGLMVYGIIDDKSRFLISLSLLVSKDAKTCANEMKKAIIFKKHLKNTDKCATIIFIQRRSAAKTDKGMTYFE